MFDHVNLPVSDLVASARFYERVLPALGYSVLVKESDAIGFGKRHWEFGIVLENVPVTRMHIAFRALSSKQVNLFFQTAIEAGAQSNGDPGYRPQYGRGYYSAFVYDADGHNIEAVYRENP